MNTAPSITTRQIRIENVAVGDVVQYRRRDGSPHENAWFTVAVILPPPGPGRGFELFADAGFATLAAEKVHEQESATASLKARPLELVTIQVEDDLYARGQADAVEALETTNADLLRDAIDEAREAGLIP